MEPIDALSATDFLAFGIPSLDRMFGQTPAGGRAAGAEGDPDRLGYYLRRPDALKAIACSKPNAGVPGDQVPALEPDALKAIADSEPKADARGEATTFCIIGPDGTGKSLFALHMVSDYWRRCHTRPEAGPRIIYASTDLSYERAGTVWQSFWLDIPEYRRSVLPFEKNSKPVAELSGDELRKFEAQRAVTPLRLVPYRPAEDPAGFAEVLVTDRRDSEVAFVDLEATTSGDDWALLHNLLAVLPEPASATDPRHLLVVDAVEGLETLVGERDAFGEPQSRRARIAQLIRAAARKCHLVFIVEERKDGERLPEVFVADVVIRVRSETDRDFARRTIEFEKVRGQPHVRGQHDFRIRQEASKTGGDANPDDPEVGVRIRGELKAMAYFQVFPSLHQRSHEVPMKAGAATPKNESRWRYASFGVYQLDNMLGRARPAVVGKKAPAVAGMDEMGLSVGSVTTLIGNESTYKSQLGRSFLSQCFRTRHVDRGVDAHTGVKSANRRDPLHGQGVAILLTTNDTDRRQLVTRLKYHLIGAEDDTAPDKPTQKEGMEGAANRGWDPRVIVRRLEPHHLPAAVLVHLIRSLVEEAKRRLYALYDGTRSGTWKGLLNRRIRLVIDDWTSILSTFPEAAKDPLLLPYVLQYLRREGVTTLILAARPGNPNDRGAEQLDREVQVLRDLADHHLFTWHVPFYGERRVAITAIPSLRPGEEQPVRELRPGRLSELPSGRMAGGGVGGDPRQSTDRERADRELVFDPEALVVDPHFQLYADLEDGRPKPVPLQIKLYAESESIPASKTYMTEVEHLFRQMFGHQDRQTVLHPQYGVSYDLLRELSYLRSEAKLDHTLVLQVDEFWAESRSELQRQEGYMNARTVDRHDTPLRVEDPFQLFQLTDATIACLRQQRVVAELVKKVHADREPTGRDADDSVRRAIQAYQILLHGREDRVAADPRYVEAIEKVLREGKLKKIEEKKITPVFRYEFFDLIGYTRHPAWVHPYQAPEWQYPITKVPYTWDFGFLMCNRIAWERAFDLSDHRTCRVKTIWLDAKGQEIGAGQTKPPDARRRAALERPRVQETWRRLWKIGVPSIDAHAIQDHFGLEKGKPFHYVSATHTTANEEEEPVVDASAPPQGVTAYWTRFVKSKHLAHSAESFKEDFYAAIQETGDPGGAGRLDDPQRQDDPQHQDDPVSWREFFGACRTIARASRGEYVAFDLDLLAVETFSCLVFEVWMSEVFQACRTELVPGWKGDASSRPGRQAMARALAPLGPSELEDFAAADGTAAGTFWRPRTLRGQPTGGGLPHLLGREGREKSDVYRRALYRAFLLLDEAFSAKQLADDNLVLRPRAASPRAVASRHWYSTAAAALNAAAERNGMTVVGLPGHFSTRGDWFLAVARGSRSPRLGERAMDILSSRRGNVSRLQAGIGLPVRTIVGPGGHTRERRLEYRTALPCQGMRGREELIHYSELRKLGAYDHGDSLGRKGNFFWLWRSALESYDIHARIWQKWTRDALQQWPLWPRPNTPIDYDEENLFMIPAEAKELGQANRYAFNVTGGEPWWDGFKEYDYYRAVDVADPAPKKDMLCFVEENDRWKKFDKFCDGLIEALGRASRNVPFP